jgi:acyl CoA:acetate/3-ketoacid CoA transferase
VNKWTNAEAIAASIFDGATIAVSGSGGGLLEPDAILAAIEARFLETGHPRDLTVVHALGVGDGQGSGLGRFAHLGMVKRVIGGHWVWSSAMQSWLKAARSRATASPVV